MLNIFSNKSALFKGKTDKTLIQLFRYTFVGGLAFLVDFGMLFILTEYFNLLNRKLFICTRWSSLYVEAKKTNPCLFHSDHSIFFCINWCGRL